MTLPLYQLVIDTIVARIAVGEVLPGGMLPSETQLAADVGVSQGTARKALMLLEQNGIVRREQGRGTFVTARTPETSLFNFFRLRERHGDTVRPEMVNERIENRHATEAERATLHGSPDAVVEINRVRSLNGVPSTIETCVVSADLFSGIERRAPLPIALYVLYQQAYGCIVLRADETISAATATAAQARTLNIVEGTALLEVERLAYDILGRLVERRRSFYRTQKMKYMVTLS
jgi:GntR family transcriptional regulator